MTTTTIAITGATDGLGRALAVRLAADRDVRLVLHGRDPAKLERVVAEIECTGGAAAPVTATADLSDLAADRRRCVLPGRAPRLDRRADGTWRPEVQHLR
ncbi:hypothetical protein GCM10017744_002190 [Streptomyces antimycoticus]|uniref:Ketoreductase (KR) domain-containing protein n=1 Tax=Streptomyces antimycoticus TaxID=68175 RepID=A0A4D4KL27_9ACTN|nr:SDR family NAD(P)-dependent oxidoreductase [Streptomyces antimycoticus]GDY48864.1 hypothetical protein SANT12839_097460 [Streptomyces antimycoticus]